MISIRPETPEDYQNIYKVNKLAFDGEFEARLVTKLRKTSGFIPDLSLVAIKDNKIVGHILFSKVNISTKTGKIPALALAPMAVLPKYQKEGVGSSLVKEGLKKCKKLGYKIIVLVGHPDYYPRFGFTLAKEKGLKLQFDAPDNAFMVYQTVPNSLDGISGTIQYPPEFKER